MRAKIAIWRSIKVTKRRKGKFLSDKEVQQLLFYAKKQADSARKRGTSRAVIDEIIIFLFLKAGLKPTELCKLQIKDLPVTRGENSIWIRNTDKVRKVSISSELAELLTRFVTLYRKKANQKDPLLQSERDTPIGYISLYIKLKRIGEQAGIGQLSPAVLRHTYIKHLYDTEQDLRYVQEQAGYANSRALYKLVTNGNIITSQKCDACGATIKKGSGKRIDSGQFLCNKCLKYFHRS